MISGNNVWIFVYFGWVYVCCHLNWNRCCDRFTWFSVRLEWLEAFPSCSCHLCDSKYLSERVFFVSKFIYPGCKQQSIGLATNKLYIFFILTNKRDKKKEKISHFPEKVWCFCYFRLVLSQCSIVYRRLFTHFLAWYVFVCVDVVDWLHRHEVDQSPSIFCSSSSSILVFDSQCRASAYIHKCKFNIATVMT